MNDNEKFAKAIAFAADKHKDQQRKDGTSYIYHPIEVARLVKNAGYGIDYQIVALLHDVLEDTDTNETEIAVFGKDVLAAVKLLTRPENCDEEEYVNAVLSNQISAVVKSCDIINNIHDCICAEKSWAINYIAKAKKYYLHNFSAAVNAVIYDAETALSVVDFVMPSVDSYGNKMRLYLDIEKEQYENAKHWYQKNTTQPDLTNVNAQYWYDIARQYNRIVALIERCHKL